jgi:hypothetical protein
VAIRDNDEVKIGIELAVYSVMEGVLGFVEVCITVAEEQSLNHGYGSAVINISTSTGTATGHDYVSSPFPNELIIMAGQERICSNLTIIDDIFVEAREELMVILETESATFSAGVEYFRKNATIQISDNDGAVVGFAKTNYTGDEGAYVEVCAIVRSLDQMTLNMSDFEGHFCYQWIRCSSACSSNISSCK